MVADACDPGRRWSLTQLDLPVAGFGPSLADTDEIAACLPNVTMKRTTIISTVAAAALALAGSPAGASAKTITCKPKLPQAVMSLSESGTNCRIAQDVALYVNYHDAVFPFRVDGHTWRSYVTSRAHNHTYFKVTTRGATVWFTYRQPVM